MVDEAEPDRGSGDEGRREERDQARDGECEAVPDGVRELVEGLQHPAGCYGRCPLRATDRAKTSSRIRR